MAKNVDISRVKGVQFVAVKFHATETRGESKAIELRFIDGNGVNCGSATMPYVIKRQMQEAGFEKPVPVGLTTRAKVNGCFKVSGLVVQEGDRNPSQWRVYGDFDIVGPSDVAPLEYKDTVDVDPLA